MNPNPQSDTMPEIAKHPPESLSGKSSKDPLTRSSSYAEMDNAASMDEVLEEPALKPSPVVSSLSSNPDHALITEGLLHERDELQKELKTMKMCIKEMDDTLDFRQEELQRQERKAKEAGQELQLCKNELKGHKEQITRLQKEKKQAQEQLDDARNHIFQLQPQRIDITETEARELFDSLYNGVQRWVSNRLDRILDMLEEGQLQTCRLDANTATSLLALASAQAMQNIDCDQSDEYVVTAIIMQFLHQSFFERRFYCPLVVDGQEQDAIAIIDNVENLMRTIPRDDSHCRNWRAEALLALVQEPSFMQQRAHLEQRKTAELTNVLGPLVLDAELEELRVSIGKNIIKPAMELAHRLQTAQTVFSVRWTVFNNDTSKEHISSVSTNFSKVTSLNLTLGGKIAAVPLPTDKEASENPAMHVTYLLDVAPGLYSRSLDTETSTSEKAICKPRVLVVVGDSKHGKPKQEPTLLRWIEDESKRDNKLGSGLSKVVSLEGREETTKKKSKISKGKLSTLGNWKSRMSNS